MVAISQFPVHLSEPDPDPSSPGSAQLRLQNASDELDRFTGERERLIQRMRPVQDFDSCGGMSQSDWRRLAALADLIAEAQQNVQDAALALESARLTSRPVIVQIPTTAPSMGEVQCSTCHGRGEVLVSYAPFPAGVPSVPCPDCEGSGWKSGPPMPRCNYCYGRGCVWYRDNDSEFPEECEQCGGTGDLGTLVGEELIEEVIRWDRGEIIISSANRIAEFAEMIDRGIIPELDTRRNGSETQKEAA